MRRLAMNPLLMWCAFAAIHLWLAYTGLTSPKLPWGDVTIVYNTWVQNALQGYWVGVDGPWVYPILAMVPMVAAMVFGSSLYGIGWFVLVVIANASVFAFILNSRTTSDAVTAAEESSPTLDAVPRPVGNTLRFVAAWWWLAFLLLLGPVALGRIDSFTVALVITGLLLTIRRPVLAGVLLAIATWVKVWPVALGVALVIAARRRFTIAIAAGVTALAVAAAGLALGAGANLFSFVTQQTSRGLQIEAPASLPWMWAAYFQPRGSGLVYYSDEILTFQVRGAGSEIADVLTTPLLALTVLAVLLLGIWVVRTGASVTRVLPPLSLALVMALIVFNKVGSPQFMLWITAPVILGIIWQGRQFAVFAGIAALLAGLTQIIYPYLYDYLISLDPGMLLVLTARNLLEVVLLGLAIRALWRSRLHTPHVTFAETETVVA